MEKMISRVFLDESINDCTSCNLCSSTCPEVFEVPDKMIVIPNANLSLIQQIEDAAADCPVSTIAIEYNNSGKRDNPA